MLKLLNFIKKNHHKNHLSITKNVEFIIYILCKMLFVIGYTREERLCWWYFWIWHETRIWFAIDKKRIYYNSKNIIL